jgi:hypothetical protein
MPRRNDRAMVVAVKRRTPKVDKLYITIPWHSLVMLLTAGGLHTQNTMTNVNIRFSSNLNSTFAPTAKKYPYQSINSLISLGPFRLTCNNCAGANIPR